MKNRLEYIDSIRGVAALIVFFYHALLMFDIHVNLVDIGRIGVVIFFIVSGVVIPWSLKESRAGAIKNFIIKRFFRLYPVYWASILFAVLLYVFMPDVTGWSHGGIEVSSAEQVLINLTMIQKALGYENVIGAFWTLFIELCFYFVCVFSFYFGFLHHYKAKFKLLILFSLIALLGGFLKYYYTLKLPIILPLSLSIMFYGAILSETIEKNSILFCKKNLIPLFFFFLILFFTMIFNYGDGWLKWFNTYLISFISCVLLLTYFKIHNHVLLFLGKISYSFYLLHAPILVALYSAFFHFVQDITLLSIFIFILSSLIVTVIISYYSFVHVELRFTKLAHIYTKKKL